MYKANDEDYLNFFEMLKFWIFQTDKNIANSGERVRIKNIESKDMESLKRAEKEFLNPKFDEKFIKYSDFSININFVTSGNYKGENTNFIVYQSKIENIGCWINIVYRYHNKKVVAYYKGDHEDNKESEEFKRYMQEKGYTKGFEESISKLGLNEKEPNQNVKGLFDYFYKMIEEAENYSGNKLKDSRIFDLKEKLKKNYNIILRGAPGTGKTYLARQIAAEMIGINVDELDNNEQFEFVQFHSSYDYTDFIEGLRPIIKNNQLGFELKKGIFYEFCEMAKISEVLKKLSSKDFTLQSFEKFLKELGGNKAKNYIPKIEQLLGKKIYTGDKVSEIKTYGNLREILENSEEISKFDKENNFSNWYSTPVNYLKKYDDEIKKEHNSVNKNYVFLIDEINRGEISKIFGELFFSIDPEYRGKKGSIKTQYSNMHEDSEEKFYIPENIYIIGTMNDIDRSVDTFDFAMRRRFLFVEIKAEDSQIMLEDIKIKEQMTRLNDAIIDAEIGNLTNDYQIGGSYFKALDEGKITQEELWKNKLEPLLEDYFRGERDLEEKLEKIKEKYFGEENGTNAN